MLQNFDYGGAAQLVVSIGALISAIVAAIVSLKSIKEVKEVKVSVHEMGVAVDGKMDQLIKAKTDQATAEATLAEKKAESVRREEGNPDDPDDRRYTKPKSKQKPKS